MLSVIMLSVIMLSVIMLSVIMLSVIILSVIMLNVKVPIEKCASLVKFPLGLGQVNFGPFVDLI